MAFQCFRLNNIEIYGSVGTRLVQSRSYDAIPELLRCMGDSGQVVLPSDRDDLLERCVYCAADNPSEVIKLV